MRRRRRRFLLFPHMFWFGFSVCLFCFNFCYTVFRMELVNADEKWGGGGIYMREGLAFRCDGLGPAQELIIIIILI